MSHNIGDAFKQASRLPTDGQVRVSREGDQYLAIEATTDGKTETIVLSEFNASRILALLSFMLGVKIVKGQRIML